MKYNYARVGGPPDCWPLLGVFDRETGEEIEDAIEANADEGWYIKHVRGPDGEMVAAPLQGGLQTERVERLIDIREKADASTEG